MLAWIRKRCNAHFFLWFWSCFNTIYDSEWRNEKRWRYKRSASRDFLQCCPSINNTSTYSLALRIKGTLFLENHALPWIKIQRCVTGEWWKSIDVHFKFKKRGWHFKKVGRVSWVVRIKPIVRHFNGNPVTRFEFFLLSNY